MNYLLPSVTLTIAVRLVYVKSRIDSTRSRNSYDSPVNSYLVMLDNSRLPLAYWIKL